MASITITALLMVLLMAVVMVVVGKRQEEAKGGQAPACTARGRGCRV